MFRHILLSLFFVAITMTAFALLPDFAVDPAISPDGNSVCFVYEDDLWLVAFKGGEAQRLTNTEAQEWAPCWSPDGRWIAFNSNREGSTYPYLISSEGGEAKVIIAESYSISDWFSDSANLLCTRYNQGLGSSFYKVSLDGSRPQLLAGIGDRYATLSPDNKTIVFNRSGNPHRESYRGSQAGELWKVDIATKTYTQLTKTDYTERYPRFSQVNNSLYYCGSDGERFQIYRVDNMRFYDAVQLTDLPLWSARDISIARKNDRMVFECFNEIWKYDSTRLFGDRVSKLEIEVNEDIWQQNIRKDKVLDGFDSYAVSPDELLIAFKHKYDTFLIPRKGGEVRQVTFDQASIGNMEFMDDKRTLVLQIMDGGKDKLFTTVCDSTMTLTPLDWFGKDSLSVESFQKDASGKWIIYYGDKRLSSRIAIGDKDLKNIRALQVSRPVVSNFAINSTGDYAVYATTREDVWMRELWLYDFAKNEHRKLLNDDAWINSITWTKDDKSLLMTRTGGIYRLDLLPRDEFEYDVDNWKEIFAPVSSESDSVRVINSDYVMDINTEATAVPDSLEAKETTPPPVHKELNVVLEGLEKRLYPILSEPNISLTVQKVIDDSTFFYIADTYGAGTPAWLKKANIYGQNSKKEFDFGNGAGDFRWAGNTVYYIQDGTIHYHNTDKGSKGEVTAKYDYGFNVKLLNTRVFEQVWGVFGLNFYDPNMHGKDWDKLYNLYHPYAEKARSIDDIAAIVNEMIGDVNASHTGFYPREDVPRVYKNIAALGVDLDYSTILPKGIRVSRVYPTSRLGSYYKLKVGDLITHIDGVAITPKTPVDSLLADKTGKRIYLRYTSEGIAKEAFVNGLNYSENRQLYYTNKVNTSKATVDSLTNGRIGYVHIPAMGNKEYDNFYSEVFRDNADKEALIIDVRGNSGGHVHDQIISLLSKKPYALSTSRRYSGEQNTEPRRAWMRPTIVLIDDNSFSDGEIFPAVYQELKLGKVVGIPTSGSVIGTWEYDLLDGSSMRLPGSGWYKLDGTNMEGNGVVPDIIVEISPEDEIAGKDTQLLRAIEEILKDIP